MPFSQIQFFQDVLADADHQAVQFPRLLSANLLPPHQAPAHNDAPFARCATDQTTRDYRTIAGEFFRPDQMHRQV